MVNQNKGTIYTVCYMFSKDSDEVADLFQETLINLRKGMPEKDEISNIKGRIYRVSLNTCISLNRKKKSRLTVAEKIIKYKRFGNNWLKFSIPTLIAWLAWFCIEIYTSIPEEHARPVIIGATVGAIIGAICGICFLRASLKTIRETLRQIDDLRQVQSE